MNAKQFARPVIASLKITLIAGTIMLAFNCPALADNVQPVAPQNSSIMQMIGGFMQNLEQQLSSLNQATTARQEIAPQPTSSFSGGAQEHSSPVKTVTVKPLSHAPLPVLVRNPLSDAREISVQQNAEINMNTLKNTLSTEDRLQSEIATLSQAKTRNATKIATAKKQLSNEFAIEKQVRSNITGWNQYLVSYDQYLTENTQPAVEQVVASNDNSGSSSDNDNGWFFTDANAPPMFQDLAPAPAPDATPPDNSPMPGNDGWPLGVIPPQMTMPIVIPDASTQPIIPVYTPPDITSSPVPDIPPPPPPVAPIVIPDILVPTN